MLRRSANDGIEQRLRRVERRLEDAEDALTVEELLAQAAEAFDAAQAALEEGDLGTYQERVEEARGYINEARELSGDGGSTSSTTSTTTTEPAD